MLDRTTNPALAHLTNSSPQISPSAEAFSEEASRGGAAAIQGEEPAGRERTNGARRSTDGPHRGVRTARTIARRTAGNRSRAAAPRDPARLRCATSLVGRKDIPLQGVAPTFTVPNAMRAGRPDTARQSQRGVRPAVLSAHQRDSRRGVNLRSLPRPSDYRSATCATVSVRSRGQGLSASRENEPSRGDPLSHPDASPQSRPAWVPSGGVVPRLEDSLLLGIPAIPAGCFSPSFGCLRTRRASAGPIASRCPG